MIHFVFSILFLVLSNLPALAFDFNWSDTTKVPTFSASLSSTLKPQRGLGTDSFTRNNNQIAVDYDGSLQTVGNNIPFIRIDTGYLSEPLSTNLIKYSQDLGDASWSKNNVSITTNFTSAPDGTLTANAFKPSATTAQHFVPQTYTKAGTPLQYTVSVYVKRGNGSEYFALGATDGVAAGIGFAFNPSDGTKYSSFGIGTAGWSDGGSTVDVLANGWYRFSATFTTLSQARLDIVLYSTNVSNNVVSYAGSNLNAFYIWGLNLENRPSATTYIPTTTTSVSRSATVLSYPFPVNSKTFQVKFTPTNTTQTGSFLYGSYTSADNYTGALYDGANFVCRKRIGGTSYDSTKATTLTVGTTYDVACRQNQDNTLDIFVNQVKGTADADTTAPVYSSTWQIGSDGNGANQVTGQLKNVKTWRYQMTDSYLMKAVSY